MVESLFTRGLDEEALRAAEAVVDLDAAERECPACGERYAAGPPRCPGCGLNLGA